MAFFTILMSTFNGEQYISTQIDSIISQDFHDWELKIFDDCSSDHTTSIISHYLSLDSRISLHVNTRNLGATGSFLTSLKVADGEWVIFCDQDDVWLSFKLSRLYKKILCSPSSCTAVLHNAYISQNISRDLNYLSPHLYDPLFHKRIPKLTFPFLLCKNQVLGCCFAIHKSVFLGFDFIILDSFLFYHDHFLALLASLKGSIHFIPEPLMLYRRHDFNISVMIPRRFLTILLARFQLFIYLIRFCLRNPFNCDAN